MKLFSGILGTSIFAVSFGAQAAVITSTSYVDFPQESYTDTQTDSSSVSPSEVSTQADIWGGEWGPYARSRGDSDGAFALRAGGQGYNYHSSASFTYETVVSNSLATAQNAWLDLHFDRGSLEAGFNDVAFSYADLEIRAQVFLNDIVRWETGALMQADSASAAYAYTYYGDFASISSEESNGPGDGGLNWGEHDYHIDLGEMAASSSMDLRYVVSVYARDYGSDGSSYTHAGMGDPFNLGQSSIDPLVVSFSPASGNGQGSGVSVSEPSSFALLGLGILLLRLKRRI